MSNVIQFRGKGMGQEEQTPMMPLDIGLYPQNFFRASATPAIVSTPAIPSPVVSSPPTPGTQTQGWGYAPAPPNTPQQGPWRPNGRRRVTEQQQFQQSESGVAAAASNTAALATGGPLNAVTAQAIENGAWPGYGVGPNSGWAQGSSAQAASPAQVTGAAATATTTGFDISAWLQANWMYVAGGALLLWFLMKRH